MLEYLIPSMQQFQDLQTQNGILHLTVILLLIDKGIVTNEELQDANARATHLIDQESAEKKEALLKEIDNACPGLREFLDNFSSNK